MSFITKEQKQNYESHLSNGEIPIHLLISCIAVLEPKISKAAYNLKKFSNAGQSCYSGSKHDFDLYIGMRNKIVKSLKGIYTLGQHRDKANSIPKSDLPSMDMIDGIIQLLDGGVYLLID